MICGCEPGDRIRLVAMPDDPCPIPIGATGTVKRVLPGRYGPGAQIDVEWDPPNETRSLMLVDTVDQYEIIDDV